MKQTSMSMAEKNRKTWEIEEIDAEYLQFRLQKSEAIILSALKDKLHRMKMLDIGVGAGRTSYFFANLTKEYIGVDYSEKMINACKERFGDKPGRLVFKVCDARNLEEFQDEFFDFVLFSYNGLDCMNHFDRLKTLKEISSKISNGGTFCFSSHNLNSCRTLFSARKPTNPHQFFNEVRRFTLLRLLNKTLSSKFENKQHAMINDGAHNFKLTHYYIRPEAQIDQLINLGFTNIKVYRQIDGGELKDQIELGQNIDPWLYYSCNLIK